MIIEDSHFADDFNPRFKVFHELMAKKIREILLVSSFYDACILDEDCRLAERIINEYRGLNLSHPPRLTWVSSAEKAFEALDKKDFDMVITMLSLADMDGFSWGEEIEKKVPDLPVMLRTHCAPALDCEVNQRSSHHIDMVFEWSGNADLLLAIIKSVEDRYNVEYDAQMAGVRVIIFVEDSPAYVSALLPILYKEVVSQTQSVMEEGLNEEHRLLTMRARPKILLAENYEQATELFDKYQDNLLGVISDVRFPRNGELDDNAGVDLLTRVKAALPDVKLLLVSSESDNKDKAEQIPACFADKNSLSLLDEVRSFFIEQLGFGDFVFRDPQGREIERATNFRAFEKILPSIPDDSFYYHCQRNDFSRWFFARCEMQLASRLRTKTASDFSYNLEEMKNYLLSTIRARRKWRQKGVVANFDAEIFDPETDFFKIGRGSLGGKARGLLFVSTLLKRYPSLEEKFQKVNFIVPQTLVITTEGFDNFIQSNDLKKLAKTELEDEQVAQKFLQAEFPKKIEEDLRAYLSLIHYPLAVRSSAQLEDAQFRAYAGLYSTYMTPNAHPDLEVRLKQLITAIKLVYASTYYQGPKSFAQRIGQRIEDEKMAVIIQEMVGKKYGSYYYPALSGVAQSYNYYPYSYMKPEEGIVTIALGLGKTVMDGGKALRFSPKYPQLLPQFSTVDDILENSQNYFYALNMDKGSGEPQEIQDSDFLELRDVFDAFEEEPLKLLCSTYVPEEQRIRDSSSASGFKVLTFAQILKYKYFPLADILMDVLQISRENMGCPVEMEFSVNLEEKEEKQPEFAFLQLRPMSAREELMEVDIKEEEKRKAFCFSTNALGNAVKSNIADIIYVKPEKFDPSQTVNIAKEIGALNAGLMREGKKYVLFGAGRWGSADPWLGIPVKWSDISAVGAIVETHVQSLKVEPSQGSHFFHNITSMGINYITVSGNNQKEFIDWQWLTSLSAKAETEFLAHVRLEEPIVIKVDGRSSSCVMYCQNAGAE